MASEEPRRLSHMDVRRWCSESGKRCILRVASYEALKAQHPRLSECFLQYVGVVYSVQIVLVSRTNARLTVRRVKDVCFVTGHIDMVDTGGLPPQNDAQVRTAEIDYIRCGGGGANRAFALWMLIVRMLGIQSVTLVDVSRDAATGLPTYLRLAMDCDQDHRHKQHDGPWGPSVPPESVYRIFANRLRQLGILDSAMVDQRFKESYVDVARHLFSQMTDAQRLELCSSLAGGTTLDTEAWKGVPEDVRTRLLDRFAAFWQFTFSPLGEKTKECDAEDAENDPDDTMLADAMARQWTH